MVADVTGWRDIPMRDINWVALLPSLGPCVYKLRGLCEPPPRGPFWRRYAAGAWVDLTLGEVADLGRTELLRHAGIGAGAIAVLERVMALAAAGETITRQRIQKAG